MDFAIPIFPFSILSSLLLSFSLIIIICGSSHFSIKVRLIADKSQERKGRLQAILKHEDYFLFNDCGGVFELIYVKLNALILCSGF